MNNSAVFFLASLSVFAGFFSLGSCSALFLRQKTRILKIALLFVTSLLLLNLGFWSQSLPETVIFGGDTQILVTGSFQALGVALTILCAPVLVETLIAIPFPKLLRIALAVWDILMILAFAAFLATAGITGRTETGLMLFVNAQLMITIAVSVAVLMVRLSDVKPLAAQKALKIFLATTAVFMLAFIGDILISALDISPLAFLDNLSLPLYFLVLNVGSFFFIARFLGSGPLVIGGKISPECREVYGMTAREIELAERLLAGKSNQEIADELFISRKTVENHLYNIYQKLGVRNRVQFLRTLENHGRA